MPKKCNTSLPLERKPEYIPAMVCLITYFILTTSLNLLAIVAVMKNNKEQTPIRNIYAAALSIADTLVSFNSLIAIAWLNQGEFDGPNHNNKRLCLFFAGYLYATLGFSLVTAFLIAMDRFLYIRYPFFYITTVTERKAEVIIAIGWFNSLAYSILVRVVPTPTCEYQCDLHWLLYSSDVIAYLNAGFFFSLVLMSLVVSLIVWVSATTQAQLIANCQKNLGQFTMCIPPKDNNTDSGTSAKRAASSMSPRELLVHRARVIMLVNSLARSTHFSQQHPSDETESHSFHIPDRSRLPAAESEPESHENTTLNLPTTQSELFPSDDSSTPSVLSLPETQSADGNCTASLIDETQAVDNRFVVPSPALKIPAAKSGQRRGSSPEQCSSASTTVLGTDRWEAAVDRLAAQSFKTATSQDAGVRRKKRKVRRKRTRSSSWCMSTLAPCWSDRRGECFGPVVCDGELSASMAHGRESGRPARPARAPRGRSTPGGSRGVPSLSLTPASRSKSQSSTTDSLKWWLRFRRSKSTPPSPRRSLHNGDDSSDADAPQLLGIPSPRKGDKISKSRTNRDQAKKARRQSKAKSKKLWKPVAYPVDGGKSPMSSVQGLLSWSALLRSAKNSTVIRLRLAKRLAVAFLFLLACWLPLIVEGLRGFDRRHQVNYIAITGLLVIFNSTANFVVYTMSNKALRGTIVALFRGPTRKDTMDSGTPRSSTRKGRDTAPTPKARERIAQHGREKKRCVSN